MGSPGLDIDGGNGNGGHLESDNGNDGHLPDDRGDGGHLPSDSGNGGYGEMDCAAPSQPDSSGTPSAELPPEEDRGEGDGSDHIPEAQAEQSSPAECVSEGGRASEPCSEQPADKLEAQRIFPAGGSFGLPGEEATAAGKLPRSGEPASRLEGGTSLALPEVACVGDPGEPGKDQLSGETADFREFGESRQEVAPSAGEEATASPSDGTGPEGASDEVSSPASAPEAPADHTLGAEPALREPVEGEVAVAGTATGIPEDHPGVSQAAAMAEAPPSAQTQPGRATTSETGEPTSPKRKRKRRRKKRKKAGGTVSTAETSQPQLARPQKLSKAEERWLRYQAAFRDYFHFRQKIDAVVPHQTLALNRGERLGVLRVKVEYDFEPFLAEAEKLCIPPGHPHADFLRGCLRDALLRLVMPALERELRRELTDKAEEHALRVFARNLRKLLLQPPVRNRRVLAIDPGLRSGCTAVALDEFGNVLGYGEFFVIGPREQLEKGKQLLCQLIDRYRIDLIAIGNGTGSRRTEPFIAQLLANELKDRNIQYCIVNEAGASLYSTSPIGREEFPDYTPALRSAISIGRRLQDPLSELVKIEPAHLGVGLYQHDIQAAHLRASLEEVVESCVNYVGVDVNTASVALLRYVSGLNQLTARRIYEYRRQNGPFRNRLQLREVPGIGEATFVQAAGFLKILDGDNPLDATWIHPESYPVAEKVLEVLGFKPQDLRQREQVEKLRQSIDKVNPRELSRQLNVGELTLRDILSQLARPGRDPREDLPGPIFRQSILRLQDLKPGMALQGTVSNVVDFGVFVDFGLPVTGLVHISEMSTKFVRDPHEVAEVGDIVHVWVREVDVERRRVSLTMIPPGTPRERSPRAAAPKVGAAPATEPRKSTQPAQGPPPARPTKAAPVQKPPRAEPPPPAAPKIEKPAVAPPAEKPAPAKPEKSREGRPARKRAAPAPVQLSEEVLSGKQPMRSFAELAQYFRLKRQQELQEKKQAAATRTEQPKRESAPPPAESSLPPEESPPPAPEAEPVTPAPSIPLSVPALAETPVAEEGPSVPVTPPPSEQGASLASETPPSVPENGG